jgi:hypothetical protein
LNKYTWDDVYALTMRVLDQTRILLALTLIIIQFMLMLWPVFGVAAAAYGASYLTDQNIIGSFASVYNYMISFVSMFVSDSAKHPTQSQISLVREA